jgi:seryl-tRNA synthetase
MLDLAFVRANLPLVEQKLRDRNMDPTAVLGDLQISIRSVALPSLIMRVSARFNESSPSRSPSGKRKGEEVSSLVQESLSSVRRRSTSPAGSSRISPRAEK